MEFDNYSSNYACQNGLHQFYTLVTFHEVCRFPSPLTKVFMWSHPSQQTFPKRYAQTSSYWNTTVYFQGSKSFLKIGKPTPNSGQMGGMNHVPNWGPTILEWPVNFTVIWCFVLSACELMRISIWRGKNCNDYTVNITSQSTKFSRRHLCTPGYMHLASVSFFTES